MTPEEIEALRKQNEEYQAAAAAATARASEIERRAADAEARVAQHAAEQKAEAERLEAARIASLPEQEQTKLRIQQMEQQIAADRAHFAHQTAQMRAETDAYFLRAHREAALRMAGPDLIIEMVSGSTPAEIDASILRAREAYAMYQNNIRQAIERDHNQRVAHTHASAVPAPPQNPAYMPPPGAAFPDAPTGPSQAAYPGQPGQGPQQQARFQGTAEDMVRSGAYTRDNRGNFLQNAAGIGAPSIQHGRPLGPPQGYHQMAPAPRPLYQPQQPFQPLVPAPVNYPPLPPVYQPPAPPAYQPQAQQPYPPQQQYPQQYPPQYQQYPAPQQQGFNQVPAQQGIQQYLEPMPYSRPGPQQPQQGAPGADYAADPQQGGQQLAPQFQEVGGVAVPAGMNPQQAAEVVAAIQRAHSGQNHILANRQIRNTGGNVIQRDMNKFMQQTGVNHAGARAAMDAYNAGTPTVLLIHVTKRRTPRPAGHRR